MGKDSIALINPRHGPKADEKIASALGWRYLPYVDGSMVDDFDRAADILDRRHSKKYIFSTIRVMAQAAKGVEIVILDAWPRFTW